MTDSRTPLHAAATFGQIEVIKLLITKGSDPNMFHDHGNHAIFQLFVPANTLEGAEKLAVVDWVIRKQEHFEIDVHAVDVLHRDLSQVIIQTQTGTSTPSGIQHSTLVDALLTRNLRLDNRDIDGSTALHEASKRGRLNVVGQLLNGFAKPMIKDYRGRTPLHYAVDLGHVAIVRRLLQENMAGIDDSDLLGRKPLSLAIRREHLDTVKLLIDLGADCHSAYLTDAMRFNAKDSFDFLLTIGVKPDGLALQFAISRKNVHYLRSCILGGVSPNSLLNWPPRPLLIEAVSQEQVPTLQLLLSMGADASILSSNGDSALWIAVHNGSHDIVNILLKAGAGTHDLSRGGQMVNLIDLATKKGYADIAEMLNKAGAPRQAADHLCADSSLEMRTAVRRNRVDISKELIRQGGNMNMTKEDRSSPFALACRRGSSKAAITLINAGLDLNLQTRYNALPLFCAAAGCLIEVVEVLLQKGANINQLDSEGQTALLYTFKYVNVVDQTSYARGTCMVKKLTSAGINVNVVSKSWYTALGTACRGGLTRIVKILLEAGADSSIPSVGPHDLPYLSRFEYKSQYLPLELAARAGHERIVQLLLAKGANWRSLEHEKAIATSHAVLVKHWFADHDDGDEETTFSGCAPPEIKLKVPSAQGTLIYL